MTTTATGSTRRKTTQAIKIAATLTPNAKTAEAIAATIFGKASPLFVRGGRLTINAAVALDLTKPGSAARVEARVQELRREMDEIGKLHTFSTQAGAVPEGQAEVLSEVAEDGE